MNNPYYQRPSPLGKPLIALLNIDTSANCITSIQAAEITHDYDFVLCSIVKYLWRLGVKSPDIRSDCTKILDYIDLAVAQGYEESEVLLIIARNIEIILAEFNEKIAKLPR